MRPGEQAGGRAGSVDCGAVEDPDGRGGDEDRPAGQHEQAEGGIGGGAGRAPDVVQAGAAGLHDIWGLHGTTTDAALSLLVLAGWAVLLTAASIRVFNRSAVN